MQIKIFSLHTDKLYENQWALPFAFLNNNFYLFITIIFSNIAMNEAERKKYASKRAKRFGGCCAEILSNESLCLENHLFSISENCVPNKETKVGEITKIFLQVTPNIKNTHIQYARSVLVGYNDIIEKTYFL